jgi:murein L,D-transpeptidase YcbB/YkuD
MARYPGATWRPLPESTTQPLIKPRLLIFHSAVARGDTLFGYFNSPGVVVESHLYVQDDGGCEQYIDSVRRADANYMANDFALSVESWDNGNPDKVPWTPAQMDRNVDIAVWAHRVHDVPLRRAAGWDGSGIGGHTDFPNNWTNVSGKTCPGLARRPQVQQIIDRARAIVYPPAPPAEPDPAMVELSIVRLPIVKQGARGSYVRIIQGLLRAHKRPLKDSGGIDGVFDADLEREVRAFQKSRDLKADGIVGKRTWRLLIGAN